MWLVFRQLFLVHELTVWVIALGGVGMLTESFIGVVQGSTITQLTYFTVIVRGDIDSIQMIDV
jgi:hypothetical protein